MKPKKRRTRSTPRIASRLEALGMDAVEDMEEHLERIKTTALEEPVEFLDRVSHGEIDEFAARIAESDTVRIQQIEEALAMLREGRYGSCKCCGVRISSQRLRAVPFAVLCLGCKRREERMGVRSGGGAYGAFDEVGFEFVDSGGGGDAGRGAAEELFRESRATELP
ncbi:MAG: TraR/DksA C4-type zinc finger protein [Candidatus Brocadiia bacterium]|nr:TraR/DksA C4-type zinc finger protein [Candidatus Brocadiia bacterium]